MGDRAGEEDRIVSDFEKDAPKVAEIAKNVGLELRVVPGFVVGDEHQWQQVPPGGMLDVAPGTHVAFRLKKGGNLIHGVWVCHGSVVGIVYDLGRGFFFTSWVDEIWKCQEIFKVKYPTYSKTVTLEVSNNFAFLCYAHGTNANRHLCDNEERILMWAEMSYALQHLTPPRNWEERMAFLGNDANLPTTESWMHNANLAFAVLARTGAANIPFPYEQYSNPLLLDDDVPVPPTPNMQTMLPKEKQFAMLRSRTDNPKAYTTTDCDRLSMRIVSDRLASIETDMEEVKGQVKKMHDLLQTLIQMLADNNSDIASAAATTSASQTDAP